MFENLCIALIIGSVLVSGYTPPNHWVTRTQNTFHFAPIEYSTKTNQTHNLKDTYLVIGSPRSQQGGSETELKFWGEFNETNYQHLESFNGQATTIDLSTCHVAGAKHIVDDVSRYDFLANGLNVKHALFERLVTLDKDSEGLPESCYIATCVGNVAKAMTEGAILEMELDPFFIFHDLNEQQSQLLKQDMRFVDPFTAVMSHAEIKNTYKAIADYLDLQSLVKKESLSFEKISQIVSCAKKIENTIALHVGDSKSLSTRDFLEEIKRHYLFFYSSRITEDLRRYYFADTPLRYFLASMIVQENTDDIIAMIENLGFYNVTVTLRKNEHNKRRKVWMLRAIKGWAQETQ